VKTTNRARFHAVVMRGHAVWDIGQWNFQIHWPHVRFMNGELFARIPIVLRMSFHTPDGPTLPQEYVSGVGLVIGFGASILYTHNS
jgi:hypothetical protein